MSKGKWDEARLGAAIGRFVLGGLLGFFLWAFIVVFATPRRFWGMERVLANAEWLFRLRVVACFLLGGGVFGVLVGNRFFHDLAGWGD